MKLKYEKLSSETEALISEKFPGRVQPKYSALRRDENSDKHTVLRPAYLRDTEKIMNSLYYNRYADKTQVFSFYKNDDISRRSYHVQLVSRIARTIGGLLGLDLDLIEAIALGHDIGHTPFGHTGERFLNKIYHERTGRYFNHNVHSVRVLDKILHLNLTLQTLDGILCHNGELELDEYKPSQLNSFDEFDKKVEACYIDESAIDTLIPSTLEACVVRICDIIAYIGKDRQDAVKTHIIENEYIFEDSIIGRHNAPMINNLIVNIVENSFGKDYLKLDKEHFESLRRTKKDNFRYIYNNDEQNEKYDNIIRPIFESLYEVLINQLKSGDKNAIIFRHHIDYINESTRYKTHENYFEANTFDDIVTDFIASMTDDYIIDLYKYLIDDTFDIGYISYFEH